MTPFRIRHAVLTDVPNLTKLITDSVRQLNAPDYSPVQIESALQYVYGVDTQLVEDGTYFVAEANGRLAGCGGWSKRKTLYGGDHAKSTPEEDALLSPLTDAAKIRAFFVHPDFARQGIGQALMGASELSARQAGFTRLDLMATLTGEPLYAVSGFIVVKRLTITLLDGTPFAVARMVKMVEPMPAETAVPPF